MLPAHTFNRSKIPLPTTVLAEDAFLTASMSEVMLTVPPLIVPPTVTLLLLLATAVYGAKALYPAFGFALLEIALYGAGLWNLMYLYVWPIVVLAALPFRRSESRAFWAAIAGLHGLCFGALCAIPYFFIGGWQMAFSWWVSGIPYDVIHCVSNTVLVFVLFPPLRRALERAKKTSGGRE